MLCQSFLSSTVRKPGLHISRKDRKHRLENMFFKRSSYGLVSMWVVMITSIDVSQEIFAMDMLKALKSSLKHRRKHVLRPLSLVSIKPITTTTTTNFELKQSD